MRFRIPAIFVLVSFVIACAPKESRPVDLVDPIGGTEFLGYTYQGAAAPFGAVRFSPDNSGLEGDVTRGFSHRDILFHPMTGDVDLTREGDIYEPLKFSHRSVIAEPGYYSVFFRKEGVKAELTATEHIGWHRYSWIKGKAHNLLIDMHHKINSEAVYEVELSQTSPNEIRGMRKAASSGPDQYVYFVAKFSRPIESIRYIDAHKEVASAEECTSTDRQVILSFGKAGGQVTVAVGVSVVGYEGAVANLVREDSGRPFDFDAIRSETSNKWDQLLSKIAVKGGTRSQKCSFYTAIYNTAIEPDVASDANNSYRRQDGDVSVVPWGKYYSTLSLSDTFQAWRPLSSLIFPEQLHDIVFSCLDIYDATGEFPIWPLNSSGTDCMSGCHSVPFIVDAYLKGLVPELNAEGALAAMVESSDKKEKGRARIEFAYDDWCIARFAEATGHQDIAAEYYKRAHNYINDCCSAEDKADGRRNEDCGRMPAEYVMSALGLYEVCPGSLQFALTTPMFDNVALRLPNDMMLGISANDPANNHYIQKVTLNGVELDKAYVEWNDLMEGGELHFELGPEPKAYSLSSGGFDAKPCFKTGISSGIKQ